MPALHVFTCRIPVCRIPTQSPNLIPLAAQRTRIASRSEAISQRRRCAHRDCALLATLRRAAVLSGGCHPCGFPPDGFQTHRSHISVDPRSADPTHPGGSRLSGSHDSESHDCGSHPRLDPTPHVIVHPIPSHPIPCHALMGLIPCLAYPTRIPLISHSHPTRIPLASHPFPLQPFPSHPIPLPAQPISVHPTPSPADLSPSHATPSNLPCDSPLSQQSPNIEVVDCHLCHHRLRKVG